jgi:uncharacterized protein
VVEVAHVRAVLGSASCWICRQWSPANPDGSLVPDVQIGTWQRAWNRKADSKRTYPPETHPYYDWALRKSSQLSEVGCIFSAQGFEFDFLGVIWGPDLVWRRDHWMARPECSHDRDFRIGHGVVRPEIALPLLKNAYRVLCTRGLRGCAMMSTDPETNDYLRRAFN